MRALRGRELPAASLLNGEQRSPMPSTSVDVRSGGEGAARVERRSRFRGRDIRLG